jgi:hypothetical protein
MAEEEFVRAADFDSLLETYEQLRLGYLRELHHSFHRLPPREPQPRVEIKVRQEPLDVALEDHPL